MKKLYIKYLILVIIFLTNTSLYSQTGSKQVYYPENISIQYNNGFMEERNIKTDEITLVPNYLTFENINKLKIVNDSSINVSSDNLSGAMLNIDKINSIDIKSGSHVFLGIGLGVLGGLLLGAGTGALVGSSMYPNDKSASGFGAYFGGLAGIPIGALIGGIIGGSTSAYETYPLGRNNYDRKKEIDRILKIDKKMNGL